VTVWYVIGLAPLIVVVILTAVMYVQHRRREDRVAVLESREPREAVQRAMHRR
jgi:cytochrome c-type biogenesis protein CcmH/NrfF